MGTTPERILLIGGAGLPAWIWDDTRRGLADSHDSQVAARPRSGTNARLRDYAEAASESAPPGRFAIVAHSSAGPIGTEVARLLPDRVTAFLAVSAVVPEPGESFISSMPLPQRWVLDVAMRIAGNRPPASAIRHGLAEGLDQETTKRIVADFITESPGLYRDKTTGHPLCRSRGYVRTLRDRELPPSLQRRFAQRLNVSWSDELNTGHLPMIEDPRSLAESIRRFLAAHP